MFGEGELRSLLIREIRSPEYRQRLLSDRWLRDKLHRDAVAAEGSFWYVGSKVEVIRCLAEFDANAAFDAAWTALTTEHWHDRERYPNLLMQIDATRAPKLLLNRLSVEPWQLIRYVIARALSRTILLHDFKALLKSGDVRQRIAACYAAGFAENGIEIRADLVEALHDSADEVVRAATNALLQLSERDLCWQLKERVLSATEPVEKWLYLDHLVEAIDPGVPFEPLPALLENLGCGISPLIFDRFNDRLKERRKELLDRLKTRRIDRD